jgi:hypothetical protein
MCKVCVMKVREYVLFVVDVMCEERCDLRGVTWKRVMKGDMFEEGVMCEGRCDE